MGLIVNMIFEIFKHVVFYVVMFVVVLLFISVFLMSQNTSVKKSFNGILCKNTLHKHKIWHWFMYTDNLWLTQWKALFLYYYNTWQEILHLVPAALLISFNLFWTKAQELSCWQISDAAAKSVCAFLTNFSFSRCFAFHEENHWSEGWVL